jgi:hypothetical protein
MRLQRQGHRAGRHRDLLVSGTMSSGALFLPFDFLDGTAAYPPGCRGRVGRHGNHDSRQCADDPGATGAAVGHARRRAATRYISAGQVIDLAIARLMAGSRLGRGFVVAGLALLTAGGLMSRPRVGLPAVRLRDPHRGQWSAVTPASRGRTTRG